MRAGRAHYRTHARLAPPEIKYKKPHCRVAAYAIGQYRAARSTCVGGYRSVPGSAKGLRRLLGRMAYAGRLPATISPVSAPRLYRITR
eukprot:3663037-Rhodomonas_salina.1